MNKTRAITVRVDERLRSEVERCAREDGTSVSRIVETALRMFCKQRRLFRPTDRDVEKAIRAFKRVCGSVSHGSLSQNIDDELYGPMQ
jgi:hypothetical protein